MAKVVNLRTRRKQRDRDKAREETGAVTPATGETAAEAARRRAEAELASRRLEGHRRPDPKG
ncbi:DUF4169 family protein [Amaricoccus sp.]|uniref:DUF4169 family protein n=1 Tax=Amaricoccus sp. TaxID=1872485 RepID=UPI001D5D86CE|nr:DUF4169 family protein [Amaricoccus sp.]MCB1404659.1 DUF4169 family protein [Paracoccaceae bacterium]HRW14646.1 DUF4169 family protein [Amaricoccus sp.]